ncbi:glycoside hydrolase family 32 protein [Swingsia samuiensis]|uniref:Glycoside hydrolase family 32 protein n=1 Tax=Swingsia samuiensis TaxID=1293412 RepID=A0A4Y6UII9_9PROT|nr:glycoside hydrolase family 32 protein [Swingsia samuiensis]QDH16884.1 glycoside hydrolase family 32 protein [Swingsia samuiensis]
MTDKKDKLALGRRGTLASIIALGAMAGSRQVANAADKKNSDNTNQNSSHPEPGNQPGVANRPVVKTQSDYLYRPTIHFSPLTGFMNDPNGLIFDGKLFHLYYQYDPFAPYAGQVHWGHATSTDLYTWEDQPIAIDQTSAGEAYTGCVILDKDNVSGLFPAKQPITQTENKSAALPAQTATEAATQALAGKLNKSASDAPLSPDNVKVLGPNTNAPFGEIYAPSSTVNGKEEAASTPSSTLPPMAGGLVAIYTRSTPKLETQYIAWSPDGGKRFIDSEHNPILDIGSNSFRDPKVFWHAESQKWVMVIVKSRAHEVSFYGSIDLKNWMHLSDFGPSGLFGVDYECPNLIELPIEENGKSGTRWVLFVSVNPGGPQGGSVTQYFVGDFDGERFIPDNTVVGITDFAKDSYAMQVYDNMPNNEGVYFAWFGNWQYCEEVPNRSWRGLMTLPRKMSLRRDEMNWLRLVQRPYGLEKFRQEKIPFHVTRIPEKSGVQVSVPTGQAIELNIDVTLDERKNALPDIDGGKAGRFSIIFSNDQGENLSIGFDAFSAQLWLDRGNLRGLSQPFFTGRFSTPLTTNSRSFSLQLVLDACALEIFANDGLSVGTALIYPTSPLDTLSLQATNAGATIRSLSLYTLRKTMDRPTMS